MRPFVLCFLFACGSSDAVDEGDFRPMCESHGTTFPLLEKSCSVTSDCFIALHMVSCCGTQTAIGLATTSESEFTAAENKCEMAYPGCGCAEGPTTAEDSRNETMGTIQVECRAGACTTFVP